MSGKNKFKGEEWIHETLFAFLWICLSEQSENLISQGGRKGDHGEERNRADGRRTGETQRDGDHVTEREHSPLLLY